MQSRSGYSRSGRRKGSKQQAASRTGRSRRNSTGSAGRRTTNSQMSMGRFVMQGAAEKQQMQDLNTRLGAFIHNTKDKAAIADKLQAELDRQRRDFEDRVARAEEDAARARAEADAEADRMRRELDQARSDAQRYKDEAAAASDKLSSMKSQNGDELARLRRELDDARASSSEAESRLREEFQKKLEDWIKDKRAQDQKDKEEWMKIFNEQNKNIKSYKDANAELRRQKEALNQELDALRPQVRDLEDKLAEKNDIIDELKRSQVTLQAEIDQYTKMLDAEMADNTATCGSGSGGGGNRKKSMAASADSRGMSSGSKRTNYLFEKGSNSKYKMQTFYDQAGTQKKTAVSSARSPKSQPRSPESRSTRHRAASVGSHRTPKQKSATSGGGSQRTNYLFEKRSDGKYEMEAFYGGSPRSKAGAPSKSRRSGLSASKKNYSRGGGYSGGGGSFAPSGYQSNGSRRTKSYVSSRRSSQKSRSNYAPVNSSRF